MKFKLTTPTTVCFWCHLTYFHVNSLIVYCSYGWFLQFLSFNFHTNLLKCLIHCLNHIFSFTVEFFPSYIFFILIIAFCFSFKCDPLTFLVRLIEQWWTLSFCLSGKPLVSLSIMNDTLVKWHVLDCWGYFCFSTGSPGSSDIKESAYHAGDLGSIPGSGRSPGEGNGSPLQCSCLENAMDRGV